MTILILLLIGRIFFALTFIFSGITQLINYKGTVQLMSTSGVPFPKFSAIASSLMAVAGGIGIVFHAYSLYGSIMIILFLLPATYFGHKFWGVKNKKEKTNQMQHFMKNISLIGGAIIIALASFYGK
ncbi:putative membrane protein [Desulfosporosinus orientis DSM 765]|uniref:Putative membrane protein n=1 Tax=Desulfosporosinus orientis (strain ATCC 19365 / DSM 765 / NCIMB 8382 / VKM B-1628 / Singapore I) TaxID=768706 RepID=G7WDE1_DESOD|nr:DoxX family protein [Desulfosporosinus orientis]AET67910.1 putative membrane protein [Desulfosporosinus orientis DSM 765]